MEPADKASLAYSCMHTRLINRYNAKFLISLVYVSAPLIAVTTVKR